MTGAGLVVVGASLAGLRAAEAARESGYTKPITLVGAEPYLPYDRPPLSKAFLTATELPTVPSHRSSEELEALDVDLRLGQRASGLDTATRQVFVEGEPIDYDALVIATGTRARELPMTDGLGGVHSLRTLDDARAIRAAFDTGARTVVVGAGFIGSEIASAARRRDLPVTMVEAAPVPLGHAIGAELGRSVSRLHEENGVELCCGVTVTGVTGSNHVERVDLSDGTTIEADLVVVGIGAVPETGWLAESGLDIEDGIACDATLNAGAPGVYAAGDVARWRSGLFGRSLRVEHWTSASEQGESAVRNALDPQAVRPYDAVPYFWSDCYDRKMQFVGVADDVDEIHVVAGDLDSPKFTALYRNGDRVVGAFTMNSPAHSAKCERLITQRASWEEALKVTRPRDKTA